MKSENMKCPRCGYVFEADIEENKGNCPLCSSEFDTSEAIKLFKNYKSENVNSAFKKRSTKQIILEWLAFFGSFAVFIFIVYMIINYIVGA